MSELGNFVYIKVSGVTNRGCKDYNPCPLRITTHIYKGCCISVEKLVLELRKFRNAPN